QLSFSPAGDTQVSVLASHTRPRAPQPPLVAQPSPAAGRAMHAPHTCPAGMEQNALAHWALAPHALVSAAEPAAGRHPGRVTPDRKSVQVAEVIAAAQVLTVSGVDPVPGAARPRRHVCFMLASHVGMSAHARSKSVVEHAMRRAHRDDATAVHASSL